MPYSEKLRKKIIEYIRLGGSKKEACAFFNISCKTLDRWLHQEHPFFLEQSLKKPWRKIQKELLWALVKKNPHWKLSEFALIFNVSTSAVSLAFKKMKINRRLALENL